jgi:arylsulfatase A-like enzyme
MQGHCGWRTVRREPGVLNMIRAALYLTLLAYLLTGAALAAENPNIVFIFVDDMGYGDAGCYNAESKIPTPHIDGLAKAGMRFTDAHAAGALCHPSRYGLLTGRHPFRADVERWRTHPTIDEDLPTFASVLKGQGYRTHMVGKWHLGFLETGYENPLPGGPVDRGFDTYFGIRASTDIPPYFYIRDNLAVQPPTNEIADNFSDGWSPIQGAFWRAGGIAPDLKLEEVTPRFTQEAIQVIKSHVQQHAADPLLLYLAYPSPHTPWLPTDEFNGSSGAGMFGDFLAMVDAEIGKVLATLEETGLAQNTLVCFASDNGPVWYDEDAARLGHDSAGPLRGMKADAWEAGHRMPFIARWPGRIARGSVSEQVICFTDMLATFADITDAELTQNAGPDSFSILPVLLGEQPVDQPIRGPVVIPAGGMMSIRSGDWKLITGLGSGGFSEPRRVESGPDDPAGQLYNLRQDLGETTNLYKQHPEVVERLTGELDRIVKATRTRE